MAEILSLSHSALDFFTQLERLQATGTPREVARAFDDQHMDAYWKKKDLPLVVAITTAGISYCLIQAVGADAETAYALRSTAKGLAYDLGSFTWPGWDEPGIVPAREQVAMGFQGAKLNLRLAVELEKPADRQRDAHWLMGAHLLAAARFEEALAEFRLALSPDAAETNRGLFQGYCLLVDVLRGTGGEATWQQHLAGLKQLGKEGEFAHEQLATAYKAISRHLSP